MSRQSSFLAQRNQGEVQRHGSVSNVTVPLVIGGTPRSPVGQNEEREREEEEGTHAHARTLNASLSTLTFSASHCQPLDLFSLRHESHT